MEFCPITAVGIDVSKGKSTVAIRRPGGEIVMAPFQVHHTASDLGSLISTLRGISGEIRVVMEHTGMYWRPIARFACGEHGDVIDFTAKLFDLSPSEAARKLAADFSVPVCDTGQLSRNPIPSNQLAKAQRIRQAELQCLSVCMDYARLLAEWKARYAPKSPEEIPDPRFTEACRKLDEYEYYVDLLTSGSGSERTELVEMLTADGTITNLQNRILQARKEEIPHAGNDRPC